MKKWERVCVCVVWLQLGAEQRGGAGGAVHQPGRVPDAGGEEAEQGRGRLPRQHPVAKELLAPRLTVTSIRHAHDDVFIELAAEFVCLVRSCVILSYFTPRKSVPFCAF